jgi:hypothetical protein
MIPANQTVSFTTYFQAVSNAVPASHEFLQSHMKRIEQAFNYGEPISMLAEEIAMRWNIRAKKAKTPRELAVRVVQF